MSDTAKLVEVSEDALMTPDEVEHALSSAVAAERARVIEIAERWAAAEACGAENAARECLAAIRALGKGGAGNG